MSASYDPTLSVDAGGRGVSAVALESGVHTHRRISWPAIFGGVVAVVTIQLLFSFLGAGVGLGTVDTNAGSTPTASSLGIGAGLWWLVTSCIALFIGGYATAWLAGVENRFDGLLHGLVTWGLATLLTLWLLTSAIGGLIGGGYSAIGGILGATGSGASQMVKPIAQAAGVTPDMIQEQAQAYLKPTDADPAAMSPQDAQKSIATSLADYARGGADAGPAKDRVVSIMAAQMKISREDAEKRFDDAQAKLKQTRDEAVRMAKNAADASAAAASTTAFAGFGVLLLGLIASTLGGSLAVQRHLAATRRVGATL